jgi:hypothetical protein
MPPLPNNQMIVGKICVYFMVHFITISVKVKV